MPIVVVSTSRKILMDQGTREPVCNTQEVSVFPVWVCEQMAVPLEVSFELYALVVCVP